MKSLWTKGWFVFFIALICCSLWGSAAPFIKMGYTFFSIEANDEASILLFAGSRFALAGGLVLIYYALFRKSKERMSWSILPAILVLAFFQTAGQYYFYYIGLAHTSGVNGAIITGMSAFFSLIVACLIFRFESFTSKKILGCLLGFLGILWMNRQAFGTNSTFQWLGEGYVLVSQVCSAFSAAFIKYFTKKHDPVLLSGCQFMLGGIALVVIGISMGGQLQMSHQEGFMNLFYLACVSAVAYTLWGLLLQKNPVSKVGIYNCLIPIIGVIISAFLLHEYEQAFQIDNLISLVLICLGIFLVSKK